MTELKNIVADRYRPGHYIGRGLHGSWYHVRRLADGEWMASNMSEPDVDHRWLVAGTIEEIDALLMTPLVRERNGTPIGQPVARKRTGKPQSAYITR